MRKAMSRKGSRRKNLADNKSEASSPSSVATENSEIKRKPSGEEAALTSKNYRMAKELSELRVRHREETKNVTRLTMENMNLASRCREAISHVSMLKKELAMHQRRAAEALKLQREQARANKLDDSMDVSMSWVERERGVSTDPPEVTEKPKTTAMVATTPVKGEGSPVGEFYNDFDAKTDNNDSDKEDCYTDNEVAAAGVTFNTKPIFPHSASPRVTKRGDNYNEGFPTDLPRSTRKKLQAPVFREAPGQLPEGDSESGSPGSMQSSNSAAETRKSVLTSIDAFEASFVTPFPKSFNSGKEGESKPTSTEIYNPFAASPVRATPTKNGIKETDAPTATPTRAKESSSLLPPKSPPGVKETARRINEASASTSAKQAQAAEEFLTRKLAVPESPQASPKREVKKEVKTSPTKSRSPRSLNGDSQKRVSAAARAKYEKAIQPRQGYLSSLNRRRGKVDSSDDSVDSASVDLDPRVEKQQNSRQEAPKKDVVPAEEQAMNNSSSVLKRLQQRRVKATVDSLVSDSPKLSPAPAKMNPVSQYSRTVDTLVSEAPRQSISSSSSVTKSTYGQRSSPLTIQRTGSDPGPVLTPSSAIVRTATGIPRRSHDSSTPQSSSSNSINGPKFSRSSSVKLSPASTTSTSDTIESPENPADPAMSPSVSSAISAYEQTLKRSVQPAPAKSPAYVSGIPPPSLLHRNSSGSSMPFDELQPSDSHKTSTKDLQSLAKRTSGESAVGGSSPDLFQSPRSESSPVGSYLAHLRSNSSSKIPSVRTSYIAKQQQETKRREPDVAASAR